MSTSATRNGQEGHLSPLPWSGANRPVASLLVSPLYGGGDGHGSQAACHRSLLNVW